MAAPAPMIVEPERMETVPPPVKKDTEQSFQLTQLRYDMLVSDDKKQVIDLETSVPADAEKMNVEDGGARETEPFERLIPGTQDMDFLLAHGHALTDDQ